MKIHTDLNNFNVHTPVVTIGTFDGIHKGHYEIISRLIKLTKKVHGESVVFTLWPHPRIVIEPNNTNLRLLNTLDEKIELLEKSGVEHLIIFPFTKEFSQLSSYDFIKNILVNKIGVKFLVFGYDHQFGRNREGKFKNLMEYANLFGFKIEKIDALNIAQINVSSTKIRNALVSGNIDIANKYLGYDYFLKGIVGEGSKIGRSLGFPTANLIVQDRYKLIPADGVYAVEVRINNNYYKGLPRKDCPVKSLLFNGEERPPLDKKKIQRGKLYRGILNIGIRPTIKDHSEDKSIEVHILDFNKNIYNKEITLIFKKKIRDEQKFDNMELLKKQLLSDKEEAISILAML